MGFSRQTLRLRGEEAAQESGREQKSRQTGHRQGVQGRPRSLLPRICTLKRPEALRLLRMLESGIAAVRAFCFDMPYMAKLSEHPM